GRWDTTLTNSPERLREPLVRRDGTLEPATWDEAIGLVARSLGDIARRDGGAAIGGIGSTHTTNEEAYLFQKLLRAGLGTNNVDHAHGRLPKGWDVTQPWVWSDSIAGLERASHIMLLGADAYHRQPIVDLRIRKAIRRGARVWIVSPEENRLDRLAAGVIRYRPGLVGAVAQALVEIILSEGLKRGEYAERWQSAHAARLDFLSKKTGDKLADMAGCSLDDLRALAREIAGAKGAVILYDEMATRETTGETLAEDAAHLAMLTDNFGRPGAGVGPLMEDNNSLGARDMGLLPETLPGYRSVADEEARAELEGEWSARLPDAAGLDYDAMLSGGVKSLYVMGANPAKRLSDEARAKLANLEFLVVQDLFLTETAALADVVLPAVSSTEKDGTFTNTERCVQVVRKATLELPGARADWQILLGVAHALGLGWSYRNSAQILAEIARTTPIYAGATRRGLGQTGARWPLAPTVETDGPAGVSGSPCLTWEMLERGVSRGRSADELALSAGRGEQA
ncbi:MAG TPA: molybdopterin-dependent oxidoreductase, partial [Ktedonobacterales bacterium]|nr:molybdopterin-dependent oxidoreductase [Ktedonobacterales bacterium]